MTITLKEITRRKCSPELCVQVQPKTVARFVFEHGGFASVLSLNVETEAGQQKT